jgi:hypothetical protein
MAGMNVVETVTMPRKIRDRLKEPRYFDVVCGIVLMCDSNQVN